MIIFFKKNKINFIISVFLLVQFVSGFTNAYANNVIEKSEKKNFSNHSVNCFSGKFTDFLNAFSEHIKIQKKFTKYPLKYIQLVDPAADPRPLFSVKFLDKSLIKYPLLKNKTEVSKFGRMREVELIGEGGYLVTERSLRDFYLGYFMSYTFIQHEKCWFLVEISDQST